MDKHLITMESFLIWNSNSLKPTTEGNNKENYIYRKLKELSDIDVICLVETHLTDNCEDNSKTSQEQIFPCQSIKDLSVTHQVIIQVVNQEISMQECLW